MAWWVAGAVFVGLMALLPRARSALRRSLRRNGRFAGAALGFGLIFSYLFEPARAAAIESIAEKKELGETESGWGGEKPANPASSHKEGSPMRLMLIAAAVAVPALALAAVPVTSAPQFAEDDLGAVLQGPQRSDANRARDVYRHPVETLTFFGVTPTKTVVEVVPGGGWYTEILAPYLRDRGHYIVAGPDAVSDNGAKAAAKFKAKLAADPGSYQRTTVTSFGKGSYAIAPAGSADVVLTFRNIHNFDREGFAPEAFKAFYTALKPGGVLGVEEHRLPEDRPAAEESSTGYMKVSTVKRLATAAGFRFVAASEVNANPKDTHDYPKGVWTLPPTYQEGDKDHAKYAAIGESDRMTLKFVKPA